MKRLLLVGLAGWVVFGLSTLHAQMLFQGDGSTEPGFVAPIQGPPPPPPPAQIASGETLVPYPGPPATPQARSEKKKPPTPPVMFTKLTSERGLLDWATRPNDINNLLKSMKEMINVDFAVENKSLAEVDADPEKNPILYRSGHFHFEFSPEERKRLREYLLRGGMIIFNPGLGSKPFYDSARRELLAMFPEAPVQRLSADHPLFHAYYDLGQVEYRPGVRAAGYLNNEPWFEAVTIECRVIAVLSRWDMAAGWDALQGDEYQAYAIDSARKLGVNLLSYATAQRAWAKNVVHSMEFADKEPTASGKLYVAQVIYDGEWKTRHAGLSVLLQQFNQRTDVPVRFEHKELRLSDPKIFDVPILYMTGHEDFRLTAAEVSNLRQYLQHGGLLFAEACCGRRAFDMAFRRELQKVLPGQSLRSLGAGDQVLTLPARVEAVGVTPALSAQLGNKTAMPATLLAVDLNGHHAVVYSPFGLAGGWELSPNPYALGCDAPGSLALGVNVLFYGITQ